LSLTLTIPKSWGAQPPDLQVRDLQARDHGDGLVGDDRDRDEVADMELARGDTGAVVGVRHPHPKHAVASSYGHGYDQDSSAAESPRCR
jgi:hypothetical protein